MTISYDLHTMNQAGIWRRGFLDLSNTQHVRDRGEGTANPRGTEITSLAGWQWGHRRTTGLLHATDLLPRGPMPNTLDGLSRPLSFRSTGASLSYAIDGRSILEAPRAYETATRAPHGNPPRSELKLCVADGESFGADEAGDQDRGRLQFVSESHHPAVSAESPRPCRHRAGKADGRVTRQLYRRWRHR